MGQGRGAIPQRELQYTRFPEETHLLLRNKINTFWHASTPHTKKRWCWLDFEIDHIVYSHCYTVENELDVGRYSAPAVDNLINMKACRNTIRLFLSNKWVSSGKKRALQFALGIFCLSLLYGIFFALLLFVVIVKMIMLKKKVLSAVEGAKTQLDDHII